MLNIYHYLIKDKLEKEKYEEDCHKESFEFLPLSKNRTYLELTNDRPFYFLVIKLTKTNNPEATEDILINRDSSYMQVFSGIYAVFRSISTLEAVSISYNDKLNTSKDEIIVHAAFMMKNDNQLGDVAFNDLTKLLCNRMNIKCDLPTPVYEDSNEKHQNNEKEEKINEIQNQENKKTDIKNKNKRPKQKYAPANLESMQIFNGMLPFTVSGTEDKMEDYFYNENKDKTSVENIDNKTDSDSAIGLINEDDAIEKINSEEQDDSNKPIEDIAIKEKPIPRKKDEDRQTFSFKNTEGKIPTNPDDYGEDLPMLNAIDEYIPKEIKENKELFIDIPDTYLSSPKLTISKEKFNNYFQKTLHYFTTTKHAQFVSCQKPDVLRKETQQDCLKRQDKFMDNVNSYLDHTFPGQIPLQDREIFLARVRNALFSYYVLTDLINHPDVTDIKVLSADKVNVKIKGIHYTVRGVRFINENDFLIFIQSLMIRNNVPSGSPFLLFSDINFHPDYILRFNVSIPALNTNGSFAMHIRKVPKNKLLMPDLIDAGMMPEKVAAYLVDKVRNGKSIVFAGPNACGKTNILNAMVEEIPYTSSILCVQESDEIFPLKHPLMMCQHILRDKYGRVIFGLDPIGQNGLVCDTGYFIIGEIKGAEARAFLRASNTGSTCLCTIHTSSAKETLPRFADYIKYGADYSMGEALRMLKDLNVIVYLDGFKIQEISEITGFDEKEQKIIYKTMYKRSLEGNK